MYAYKIKQNAGALVCTLFAGGKRPAAVVSVSA
nr:MAG TPA: hypothetical protein [Caudoviricetes sp.]